MEECWYALALSLLATDYYTPEMAFQRLDKGADTRKRNYNDTLTDADFEDMLKLKKDLTFKDLADIYGVETTCLFKRIKNFEKNKIKGEKQHEKHWYCS